MPGKDPLLKKLHSMAFGKPGKATEVKVRMMCARVSVCLSLSLCAYVCVRVSVCVCVCLSVGHRDVDGVCLCVCLSVSVCGAQGCGLGGS